MDVVSYILATTGVKVSLATTTSQVTLGAGSDTLVSIENLTGSSFNDTLTGNSGNNVLRVRSKGSGVVVVWFVAEADLWSTARVDGGG